MDDFFPTGFDDGGIGDPFGDQNDFLFGNDDIGNDLAETEQNNVFGQDNPMQHSDANHTEVSSMYADIPASALSLENASYPFPVKPGGVPPYISPALLQYFFPNLPASSRPVVVNVISQANLNIGVDLRSLSCSLRTAEYMPDNRIPTVTLRLQNPNAVVVVRSSGALTIIGSRSVSESRQAAELAARIMRKTLNLTLSTFQFRVRSISARFNACSPVRLDALGQHSFQRDKSAGGVSRVLCHYEPERFNGCTIRMVGQSSFCSPRSGSARTAAERRREEPSSFDSLESPNDGNGLGRKRERGKSDAELSKLLRNRWCVSCVVYVTGKMTFLGARSPEELEFAFNAAVPIIALYLGRGGQSSDGLQDDNGGGDTHSERVLAPPSRENVEKVIQHLREQWSRHQRALAAHDGGADWEDVEDEEMEEGYAGVARGGMMDRLHGYGAEAGADHEDEEDLEDYEDEMDDGMGGDY